MKDRCDASIFLKKKKDDASYQIALVRERERPQNKCKVINKEDMHGV